MDLMCPMDAPLAHDPVGGVLLPIDDAVWEPVACQVPVGWATQLVPLQVYPEAQSEALVQVLLQPAVEQAYPPQACPVLATQVPAVLQVPLPVNVPPVQVAVPQEVGKVHCALAPPHVPAQSPVPAHACLAPTGAPVTKPQDPAAPLRLHAWHWPLQRSLQQTPSVQKPLVHSRSAAHAVPPLFFEAQLVPAQ